MTLFSCGSCVLKSSLGTKENIRKHEYSAGESLSTTVGYQINFTVVNASLLFTRIIRYLQIYYFHIFPKINSSHMLTIKNITQDNPI